MDIRPPGDGADSVEMEPEESMEPEACFTEGERGARATGGGRKGGSRGGERLTHLQRRSESESASSVFHDSGVKTEHDHLPAAGRQRSLVLLEK